MHTQCPDCRTVFRVTADQLRAAEGRVRCGNCKEVFNANENLVVHLPLESAIPGSAPEGGFSEVNIEALLKPPGGAEEDPLPPPERPPARTEPSPAPAPMDAGTERPSPFAQVAAEERARGVHRDQSAEASIAVEPRELHRAQGVAAGAHPGREAARPALPADELPLALKPLPPSGGATALVAWSLGSLLLVGILVGQFAWFQRDRLAVYPELRPWLERMCEVGHCSLPLRRAPDAIRLARRDIRSHSHYKEALIITGTLLNSAAFPQPYPEVEVVLHDLSGNAIASRRFRPEEYLAEGTDGTVFNALEQAELHLEVADPDARAVGFEFTFY